MFLAWCADFYSYCRYSSWAKNLQTDCGRQGVLWKHNHDISWSKKSSMWCRSEKNHMQFATKCSQRSKNVLIVFIFSGDIKEGQINTGKQKKSKFCHFTTSGQLLDFAKSQNMPRKLFLETANRNLLWQPQGSPIPKIISTKFHFGFLRTKTFFRERSNDHHGTSND